MQRRWEARPRWRLIGGQEIALGPGKADLLEAIQRHGSITAAARDLGMSYRRAWLLVETMNRCFPTPLVATSRWRGRGASLSEAGREVLNLYRDLERKSLRAARQPLRRLEALLGIAATKPAGSTRGSKRRTARRRPAVGEGPRPERRTRRADGP
ncbi:MAG TPA: LysR family transcriptional regulator [Candidatus Polarisedimenticolia bacterium]|nr:LysR family transcriptional regulator [Candidatus Polarisedimenticolia bacterium]